jgi:hypothetical protein
VANLVIGLRAAPLLLADVARIAAAPTCRISYVWHGEAAGRVRAQAARRLR